MDRVKVMNGICRMIEKRYKGTYVPFGGIDLSKDGDYVILKVIDMKERNMPFCAKRIIEKLHQIKKKRYDKDDKRTDDCRIGKEEACGFHRF